jgi:hypothetical protein
MNETDLKIMQSILLGLGVLEAAQPYIDKIVAMNEAGATGEDILAATVAMRKESGAKLDKDLE